MLKQSLQ
jgi:hypothetical protein